MPNVLDLGIGELGELGLGYFDKKGGGCAIGTRRTLNEESKNLQTVKYSHSDVVRSAKGQAAYSPL